MTTPTAAPDIEAMIDDLTQCVNDCGGEDDESQRVRNRGIFALEALRTALAAGAKAVEEVDHLSDQLHEARQQPWPKWAERILQILQGYGYEAEEDGVDLPECLADWFEGFDSEQTLAKSAARALASEARVLELEADIERKDAALTEGAKAFRWYEQIHAGKTPPDTDKATRNREFAEKLEAALAKKEPADG